MAGEWPPQRTRTTGFPQDKGFVYFLECVTILYIVALINESNGYLKKPIQILSPVDSVLNYYSSRWQTHSSFVLPLNNWLPPLVKVTKIFLSVIFSPETLKGNLTLLSLWNSAVYHIWCFYGISWFAPVFKNELPHQHYPMNPISVSEALRFV